MINFTFSDRIEMIKVLRLDMRMLNFHLSRFFIFSLGVCSLLLGDIVEPSLCSKDNINETIRFFYFSILGFVFKVITIGVLAN